MGRTDGVDQECYSWGTRVSEFKQTQMVDVCVYVCMCVRHRTSNISLIQSVKFVGSVVRVTADMRPPPPPPALTI
jgi:hypothetical protein